MVLLKSCQATPTTVAEAPPSSQLGDELWLALFAAAPLAIVLVAFFLGRMSSREVKKQEKVSTNDAGTQKPQPVILERLKESWKNEQVRVQEYQTAARESRKAMDLAMTEIMNLRPLVQDAAPLFPRLITAVDDHMDQCPQRLPIVASKKDGICWHFQSCHCAEQITESNLFHLRTCAYCGARRSPLDFVNLVRCGSGASRRVFLPAWGTNSNKTTNIAYTSVASSSTIRYTLPTWQPIWTSSKGFSISWPNSKTCSDG